MKEFVLGTAQFGLDYGIANKKGKISRDEVFSILDYVWDRGVRFLDTAFSYGESEKVIGEFIQEKGKNFNVISKFSCEGQNLREMLDVSLANLKRKSLYGYIVHKFSDFMEERFDWEEFEKLKQQGLVEKIGFSLYYPGELEELFNRKVNFDLIQIPYSVFDRRFEHYFEILVGKGVEVYVRSIFLQGFAFLQPGELPPGLQKAKTHLSKLRELSSDFALSIAEICMGFVMLNKYIKGMIVGVDSLDNVQDDINIYLNINVEKIRNKREYFSALSIEDEDIIIPCKWQKIKQPQ